MRQCKTAVIVIDMLEDFISGALKCERAAAIVPETARMLSAARAAGVPVIFCCDAHRKGIDRELGLWGEHAIAGTAGAQVASALKPEAGDFVVTKRRYSAFFGTELDLLLRELGAETLILAGIQAHICVQHTAADAYFRGYKIVLAEGLVEAFTKELADGALRFMTEMYGAAILPVGELFGSGA